MRRIARDGGVSGSCARLRLAKASGEAFENAPDVARFLRTLVGVAGAAVCAPVLALAQAAGDRSDAGLDADDARNAAILGTFNLATPEPFGNLYSTAPGAEQQAVTPSFRFYTLLPLNFDSNAESLSYGGTQSWGAFPVANLSAVAPVGDLPFRVSVSGNSQFKRFFDASDVDVDRLTFSCRIQYVDPTNDQAFSPFFAITPRFSYLLTFSDQTEVRQDFNLGFNRRFNLNGAFELIPIAADTSAETVWSFGLTASPARAATVLRRGLSHPLGLLGHFGELKRELRRRAARTVVRSGPGRGDEPRLGGAAHCDPRVRDPDVRLWRRQARQPDRPARHRPAGLAPECVVDRPRRQLHPVRSELDAQARLAVLRA